MAVTLLLGATEYPLEVADARWLESTIRTACVDAAGRAWDREARAALQVADVIAEDVGRGHSSEPMELSYSAVLGLLYHALLDKDVADVRAHVARSDGVAALYLGLRRFAREAA